MQFSMIEVPMTLHLMLCDEAAQQSSAAQLRDSNERAQQLDLRVRLLQQRETQLEARTCTYYPLY